MSEKNVESRDAMTENEESLSSSPRHKISIERYRNRYWEMAGIKAEGQKRKGTHIY